MDRVARKVEITSLADIAPARPEAQPADAVAHRKIGQAGFPCNRLWRVLRSFALFLALLAVVILLQWLGSAYSSEFSGADEPAHFITGLMIRDYVASGFPDSPVTYAEKFYVHYPRVAFGMC